MEMPARIGKYEIIDVIGINMGVVYKARDSVAGHLVALKIFGNAGNAEVRDNLLKEVQLLGMLRHPNILAAPEVGEYEGKPYISV
jgi:eukaryotic-like serine/threonine-protein kinase